MIGILPALLPNDAPASSGHRKPLGLSCNFLYHSCIYWRPGTKLGGCVGNTGIFSGGSPMMLRMMQNSSGSCVMIGWILPSTFLYFLVYTTPGTKEWDGTECGTGGMGRRPSELG
jgi:hypothetical protein